MKSPVITAGFSYKDALDYITGAYYAKHSKRGFTKALKEMYEYLSGREAYQDRLAEVRRKKRLGDGRA